MRINYSKLRSIIKEELGKAMVDESLGDYIGYTTWIPGTKNPHGAGMKLIDTTGEKYPVWKNLLMSGGDKNFSASASSESAAERFNAIDASYISSLSLKTIRESFLALVGAYLVYDNEPNPAEYESDVASELILEAAKRGIFKWYKGTIYRGVTFSDVEPVIEFLAKGENTQLLGWLKGIVDSPKPTGVFKSRYGSGASFLDRFRGSEKSNFIPVTGGNRLNYYDFKPLREDAYFLSFSSSFDIAKSYLVSSLVGVGQDNRKTAFGCVVECQIRGPHNAFDVDWMSFESNKFGTSGRLDEVLATPRIGGYVSVVRIHIPLQELYNKVKDASKKYPDRKYNTFVRPVRNSSTTDQINENINKLVKKDSRFFIQNGNLVINLKE
jgi:hypothetical protein